MNHIVPFKRPSAENQLTRLNHCGDKNTCNQSLPPPYRFPIHSRQQNSRRKQQHHVKQILLKPPPASLKNRSPEPKKFKYDLEGLVNTVEPNTIPKKRKRISPATACKKTILWRRTKIPD